MSRARLLLIGSFGEGHLPASYARAFEQAGAVVLPFDSDRAYFESAGFAGNRYLRRLFRPMLWQRINRATLDAARRVRPHAILAFKAAYLEPDTVRRLRRELGVPFVNYYPDNPFCGVPLNPRKTSAQRRNLLDVLKEYSHVWTWEPGLVKRLASRGVAASYLPFGVDRTIYRPDRPAPLPCGTCPDGHRVVFVGQHSDKREAHLAAVHRHRAAIWGSRWTRAARRLGHRHALHAANMTGAEAAALYRRAGVSLNVLDDLNMPGHNMRTFEITGSGGLMLASFTEEQAAIFPPDEAAMYFRHEDELDERLDRALHDLAWAARLRDRAVAIAREHTYERRAAHLLAELGLSGR